MIDVQLVLFLCNPVILLALVWFLQRMMNELHNVHFCFGSDKHPNIWMLAQNLSKVS